MPQVGLDLVKSRDHFPTSISWTPGACKPLSDGIGNVDSAASLIMAIDALVWGSTIGSGSGSGSGWEVDGDSALNRIIAAL
ncbi:hypothetical protein Tco_0677468 [Tanacetum coccineum]|uniref:Uncharacterized protein n=1 Tax=Tanacetum coccineum TaxID=301880 RepID=A0ABQ4XCA7_9ASTR